MTEENGTATDRSPMASRSFVIAGVAVGLIALTGIAVGIGVLTDDPDPSPSPSDTGPTATASASATPAADASVCGLPGVEMTGRLTTPPEATWEYMDVYAYPVSPAAGPGETASEGYRYCYQRTPTGALFAAAYASVAGSVNDQQFVAAWLDYALAPGANRDEILSELGTNASQADTRAAIEGFRILHYDGTTARVDIAFAVASGGQTVTLSAIYELAWADGDWKLNTDVDEPLRVAQVPNTTGYVRWGEA
ncbi:hypothetical protein [Antribacter gilvus]|uniref:hypothetical protein n=1 Tax=Antribacter gilvus TaxID=2304675 RepID=UPI000F7947EE|nr:hypothetical protein [Antribacter gilvus]